MLNVINGDGAAVAFAEGGGQGEVLVWREALSAGPGRARASHSQWIEQRARFLAGSGDEFSTIRDSLREQDRVLDSLDRREVVLWFGRDLFCQACLLYVLERCARPCAAAGVNLALVCPEETATVERPCLGSYPGDALVALSQERRVLDAEQLRFAREAWQAWSSADPSRLDALAERDAPELPSIAFALDLHRQRFPDLASGLGRTQRRYLELLQNGSRTFAELFRGFGAAEPGYGWGDRQVWDEVRELAECERPLLSIETADGSGDVWESRLDLSDTGRRVLAGEQDHIALNGAEQWLGGVHLRAPASVWRWDAATRRIVDGS